MSSIGQSIRNNFPLWSKIRRDDSSIGAIMLDSIGSELEDLRVDILKREYQQLVFAPNPVCEPGNLYVFSLSESPLFNRFLDENRVYESLVAEATVNNSTINLINTFSYDNLVRGIPTRIEVLLKSQKDYLIETVEKLDDNTIQRRDSSIEVALNSEPKRLYLNIFDSTNYETPGYDRSLYDRKYVTIRGTDIFGKRIEETIRFVRDGLYKTSEIFRTIEPLELDSGMNIKGGSSIECYGFDGTVEILRYPLQVDKKHYEFKLLTKKVDEINHKGSLEETTAELRVEGSNRLQYIFNVYAASEEYLNNRTDVEKEYYEQVFLEQDLLNIFSEEIVVQDFCFDTVRNNLTVIDSNAKLYHYELKKSSFRRPSIERTKKSNITLESEKQQVVLGETLPIFASLERAKGNVSEVIIAKQTPSVNNAILDANGNPITDFNFEYLQEDYTWSKEKHFFSGKDNEDIYLNFEGKTIQVDFNEYGQHDFYIISFASQFNKEHSLTDFINGDIDETTFKKHLNKYLEDEFQETVLIDTYSVMCEANRALAEYDTGILDELTAIGEEASEYSLGAFYEGPENKLFIIASNESNTFLYEVKEYKDYIIFDYDSGEGAVLEEYDSIKVTLNNSFEEVVTYNG